MPMLLAPNSSKSGSIAGPTKSACRDWSALDGAGRDAVVQARGVAGLAELREAAVALGVRLIACEAGLLAEGMAREDLLAEVEVAGVATFLEAAGRGQVISL